MHEEQRAATPRGERVRGAARGGIALAAAAASSGAKISAVTSASGGVHTRSWIAEAEQSACASLVEHIPVLSV